MTRPEMPDGLYIKWKGRIRPTGGPVFPEKAVLVGLDPGETAPIRYERDNGHERWIYVPESELEEYFSLRTSCQWIGRRWPVMEWRGDDRILIAVSGIGGPEKAERLGLTPTLDWGSYVKELPVSEVTELRQERRDIPLA